MVKSQHNLDLVFHALADPTRRALLRTIGGGSPTVSDLARPFDMSLVAVSKHLKVLEQARLVVRTKRGRAHHVRLEALALKPARDWFGDYEAFWTGRIDALQALLEGETDDTGSGTV